MKRLFPVFILLLFVSLQSNAQDVAISKSLKTHFHFPLSLSGENILVLSTEKGTFKLENWNKDLSTRTLVADIDVAELKEIGDNHLTDAFIVNDRLVIVQSVFSRNPNILQVYIGQFDLEGNRIQPWEKMVEIERTNRIDNSFEWVRALSPDKSKYLLAVRSKWTKENAKYVLGMYAVNTNELILETAIQTEDVSLAIDSSILSLNDKGDFALWVGGEMDRFNKPSSDNKDLHHLYVGNSETKEIKEFVFDVPTKFIGSTSILMQQNGDLLALGMTKIEASKEDPNSNGFYRAVLKKGAVSFDFQTYALRTEIAQKYYSLEKSAFHDELPTMKTKGIFVHQSGDITFVAEEYFETSYSGIYSRIYGSIFAVRMDASGKVIYDDLCYKHRRSSDMDMEGSLAFLTNDTLRILFKENSNIWQAGERVVFDLTTLQLNQAHYCYLTSARFDSDGFTFAQLDTKKGKNMCVDLYPNSFLGEKTILGIGRQVNSLYFIRMTLP